MGLSVSAGALLAWKFACCVVLGGTQCTGLLYVVGSLKWSYHDVFSLCLCQMVTVLS